MTDTNPPADREYRERIEFTSALGFGDDKTERAARLPEIIDNVEEAFAAASAHDDCPVECPGCGETLADKPCEWCHGSGCGPGTASGAYEECSYCGGDRLIHEGCAHKSYADLVAERDAALARVEELERQLATAREEAAGKALLAAISNIETVIDALTVTKGANFSGAISGLERAKSILHSRAEQAAKAYRAALGTAGPEPLRGPDTAMDEFEAMDDIDRRWE